MSDMKLALSVKLRAIARDHHDMNDDARAALRDAADALSDGWKLDMGKREALDRARARFGGKPDEWIVAELEERLAAAHSETQKMAQGLLTFAGLAGGECEHGRGMGYCPFESEGADDGECSWNRVRRAWRHAKEITG